MADSIPLRIVVERPVPGVALAVQLGRDALLPPSSTSADTTVFELALEIAPTSPPDAPRLRGPAAQGPSHARFVYVTVGQRAGDAASPWDRRAKVSLATITAELLASWRAAPGSVLEARVNGTGRDGTPACATVPLLGGGWQVRPGP